MRIKAVLNNAGGLQTIITISNLESIHNGQMQSILNDPVVRIGDMEFTVMSIDVATSMGYKPEKVGVRDYDDSTEHP